MVSRGRKKSVSRQKTNRSGLGLMLFISLCTLIGVSLMTVTVVMGIPKTIHKQVKKIPVMEISLDGVTLAEVHENGKDMKYTGNILSVDGETYEDVEFKGRGNYSWITDKKSYRIKFDSKVDLLGMGKAKKWALIANDIDDTLMRNDFAYYLMDMITGGYPLRGEYVELVIDGEQLGLYYVIKTMEIDKRAVDLRDPMGILVEMDNAYCWSEEYWYETKRGNCLTIKDAVADDNAMMAMADFEEDFEALERAVSRGDYEAIKKLVDIESFAEYFIVSELTANPDAYVTSWFFYKDGLDDKIHAGLAWDFDAAFGNRNWGQWLEDFYAPTTTMARMKYVFGEDDSATDFCKFNKETISVETVNISQMMCEMMNATDFREAVSDLYHKRIDGKEGKILNYIDLRAGQIREAAKNDEVIWGKKNFDAGVEYLKEWMRVRLGFFKSNYVL